MAGTCNVFAKRGFCFRNVALSEEEKEEEEEEEGKWHWAVRN